MARRVPDRFTRVARLQKMELPPGGYPHSWIDGGTSSATHYLHSSIQGFNADYEDLIKSVNLNNVFRKLETQVYQISQENIKVLKQVSQGTRIMWSEFGFGKDGGRDVLIPPDLSKPVDNDPFIRALFSPTEKDPAYMSAIQDLKHVLNWHTFEDEFIRKLNEDYTKGGTVKHKKGSAEYNNFYAQVGGRIGTVLQKFLDVTKTVKREDVQSARTQVQKIVDAASQNPGGFSTFIFSSEWRKLIRENQFSQVLGRAYEDLIVYSLNDALLQLYYKFGDDFANLWSHRTGQKNKLTDALIHGRPIKITEVERFQGTALEAGISAKLRQNNSFELTADVQFSDLADRLNEEGSIQDIEALAYIYNNYIALSTWNTDISTNRGTTKFTVGRKNKKQTHLSSFRHRKEALMAPNTALGKFFKPLAQYINMLMLNLSFFGNRLDANNIPIFDAKFFQQLDANIRNYQSTPPAFIFTSNHVYETGDVFDYYLKQSYSGKPLFTASQIFGSAFSTGKSPYKSSDLVAIYRRKREILRNAREGDFIYPLLQDKNIMSFMPNISAFAEMIKNSSRTLATRIKLADVYPH